MPATLEHGRPEARAKAERLQRRHARTEPIGVDRARRRDHSDHVTRPYAPRPHDPHDDPVSCNSPRLAKPSRPL
jgi:hypothetical protein